MKIFTSIVRRSFLVAAALALSVSCLAMFKTQPVLAFPTGGQVQSRAIYMTSSTPSASSVKYLVTFKPASTTSIKGIILDFCSGSPIIGESTCSAPTSFSIGTPTVTFASTSTGSGDPVTSTALPGSWTAASLNSGRTLKLTAAAGSGSLSTSTLYNFAITTVTNPSTTGTFYARIITYTSDTGDIASYAPGTEGSTDALDYGGIALSTASAISITAKVQETLTFCVSKAAPGNGCTSTTTPTLTLGHGSPATLDTTLVDTDTAYTQISSNATSGVVVNLKVTSSTACAGLSKDSGSTCGIPAIGSFAAMTAGTAAFGLNVANGSGGSGTVTANSNYGTTSGSYGMRNATFSTYGDAIESSSAPTANVNSLLTYAATASATTSAGIYTATHSLIATGTF